MCACLCTLPGVKQEQKAQGLVLTLVEPDARVKVEVVLRLRDLLAHAHPGEGCSIPCVPGLGPEGGGQGWP